jgi:hypothetical protein
MVYFEEKREWMMKCRDEIDRMVDLEEKQN